MNKLDKRCRRFRRWPVWLAWWAGVGLLAVAAGAAQAERLRVEALSLQPATVWTRATPQREREDAALLLEGSAQAASLQVAIPWRAPRLRGDADAYYRNLTAHWRSRHGGEAAIGWLDLAGIRWLACQRPSSDGRSSVFHLSSVFAGRAYSLLVFAPAAAGADVGGEFRPEALPAPARDLLAGVRLGDGPPGDGQLGDGRPGAALAWVKTRVYRSLPRGEALAALVQADAERLGEDGMLTGYGLDYGESALDWSLEGFQWQTVAGRVTRVPWAQRGRLEVAAPAQLAPGADWLLRLSLAEDEDAVEARLRVWDLCAPEAGVTAALERLQQGVRRPMERLAGGRAPGCPSAAAIGVAESLRGERGKTTQAAMSVAFADRTMPAVSAAHAASLREAGLVWAILVEVALEAGASRTGFGDDLLRRARLFFLYLPER